jgi:hypothetical protein
VKDEIQVLFNLNQKYVGVNLNSTEIQSKHLELELYDLNGKKIYTERLNSSNTRIPMQEINNKGFLIAVVKDSETGARLAIEKIIIN